MKRHQDALFALEWRSYQPYLPLDAKSRLIWGATLLVLLAASLAFIGDSVSIESVFAFGAFLVALLSGYISMFQSLILWENGFREWWLTIPAPRRDLLRAMALAAMRMQAYAAFGIWLVCGLHGLVIAAMGTNPGEAITGTRLLGDWFAYGFLYAMLVPLFTAVGYLILGMYYGWRRWLVLPFFLVLMLPILSFAIVANPTEGVQRWLQPDAVFVCALIGSALAALLYRGMLAFVTRYGMTDLARHRPGGHAKASEGKRSETARSRFRVANGGFAAIYGLERARFRHFASLTLVRILYACACVLIGIGGYYVVRERSGALSLIQVMLILMAVVPALVLSTLTQFEANKRRIDWWLSLPYGRKSLLFARMAATWVSILTWMGGLFAAAAAGGALHGGGAFAREFEAGRDGMLLSFMVLTYLGGGLVINCILIGQSYAFRNRLVSWLYVPLVSGIYFVPLLVDKWILTDDKLQRGVGPTSWIWLGIAAAACVPLAVFCFNLGARWVHLYPFNTQKAGRRSCALRDTA
ncbi:hypothetical protein [Cohnella nanjingensis]|uniref:Uncharacterized protein n=1 Tax=Cohnella nanjingensis TaxID=1387779 RepID=A0A7X0VEE1_9BACL|nr:hypothetical protein [Cohnella nanjingensis]MBB6670912.1 hypothetical protein [Cohnella nanjingensis]